MEKLGRPIPKALQDKIDDEPEFPELLGYLWEMFNELSLGIASNGMGPAVATWLDVQCFCAATGQDLWPREKRALIRLSFLRAAVQAEQAEAKAKQRAV